MNAKHLASGSLCPPVKNDLLRIYSMEFCPFAQRTRIILNMKNVPHEIVNINLTNKPDWYFEINPLGKVPSLQLNGRIMYESMITCDYINEVYPEPPMYSDDSWAKGFDKCLIEVFGSKVNSSHHGILANCKDDAKVKSFNEILGPDLEIFEEELSKRGTLFFGGVKPGMLDCCIFPWIQSFPVMEVALPSYNFFTKDRYPLLHKYLNAMMQVDAVKRTVADDEQVVTRTLKKRLDGIIIYDF